MAFPTSLSLEGDTLEDFLQFSGFFQALDRWEGHKNSYTLTAKRLFDDDQPTWRFFVELFFPDKAPTLRKINNGVFSLVGLFHYNKRGDFTLNQDIYTDEDVDDLFDFLLIDVDVKEAVLNYIKDLHFHVQGRPARPEPLPPRVVQPARNEFNVFFNGNNTFPNNESEENENNVQLGFKNDEEEEAYGKLKSANYKRFAPNGGKRRKNKTKKLKKRSS